VTFLETFVYHCAVIVLSVLSDYLSNTSWSSHFHRENVISKAPHSCLAFCFRFKLVGSCLVTHGSIRNWARVTILKFLKHSMASCLVFSLSGCEAPIVKLHKMAEAPGELMSDPAPLCMLIVNPS
jgi:hypothetical protein